METSFNKQAAGSGAFMMEKMMEGTAFAGTGTPQEIVELEKNLRQLLQVKMYPYSYLESYLISQGYQQSDIRQIFKEIAGVSVDVPGRQHHGRPGLPALLQHGLGRSQGLQVRLLLHHALDRRLLDLRTEG